MSTEHNLKNTYGGKLKHWKRNLSIITLFITNTTWTGLELNLGFCTERLAQCSMAQCGWTWHFLLEIILLGVSEQKYCITRKAFIYIYVCVCVCVCVCIYSAASP